MPASSMRMATCVGAVAGCTAAIARSFPPSFTDRSAAVRSVTTAPDASRAEKYTVRTTSAAGDGVSVFAAMWPLHVSVSAASHNGVMRARIMCRLRDLVNMCGEICRQTALRVTQNLDDRLPIRPRESRVPRACFVAREHGPQPPVDGLFRFGWQAVERRRVNHVAARMAKQTPAQVQITERAIPSIARSFEREPRRERRAAWNDGWKPSLVDKQHVVHELVDGGLLGTLREI